MSSCRSTSFYVAPGHLRYFRDATVAALYDNEWHEFKHRRDIENFAGTHPDWDHTCYVGPAGGLSALHEALSRSPEDIELWRIDQRTVHGRAPAGPAATLYALAHRGLAGAGGLNQVTERLFPGANKPLRRAVSQVAPLPGGHLALSLAVALRPHRGDDAAAALLENSQSLSATTAYQPVDPELISTAHALLSEHYSPPRAYTILASLSQVGALNEDTRVVLATHTDNVPVLRALSTDSATRVRAECARNKHTPHEILKTLADDADDSVRWAIARNFACPTDILTALSNDISAWPRRAVAENPTTPAKVLFKLLDDEAIQVLSGAAQNPTLSPKLIQKAADRAEGLYKYLATNPATPPKVLEQMLSDALWVVAKSAARNPSCPPEALTRLVDEDSLVGLVANNPAAPGEALARLLRANVETTSIIKNPACPISILTSLSDSKKADTRMSVAENESTPPEILTKLAGDEFDRVRKAVATNPSCPPQLFSTLARDPHRAVRIGASHNPNCPASDMATALATSTDPEHRALSAVLAAKNTLTPMTTHPAISHLKEVLITARRATQDKPVVWPTRPKIISDLPARAALPWSIDSATDALVGQGVTIADTTLTLRRLESKHSLEQNATYMGNCTAGYGGSIARGETVILALDDDADKPVYNVEICRNAGGSAWELGQVNSRFNSGGVPPAVTKQLRALVKALN